MFPNILPFINFSLYLEYYYLNLQVAVIYLNLKQPVQSDVFSFVKGAFMEGMGIRLEFLILEGELQVLFYSMSDISFSVGLNPYFL